MLLNFETKRDINGNTYTLTIDYITKEFWTNYNPFNKDDFIRITKTDRRKMINQLIENGFTWKTV